MSTWRGCYTSPPALASRGKAGYTGVVAREFSVDRAAVATVAGLGFGVWPAVIGATLWKLGVPNPSTMGAVNIGVAIGVALIGTLAPRQVAQQLRESLGVKISEHGIATAKGEIAWADVTAVDKPAFGTRVIKAEGREITVQTYLFRARAQLEKLIDEHAPPVEPPLG